MSTNRPEILDGVLSPGEIMTIGEYIQTLDNAGERTNETVVLKTTVMLPVNSDGSDPVRSMNVDVNVNVGILEECQQNRRFMRRYIDELGEDPKRMLMDTLGDVLCTTCGTNIATSTCAVQEISFVQRRFVIRQVRPVCGNVDCINTANARSVEFTHALAVNRTPKA